MNEMIDCESLNVWFKAACETLPKTYSQRKVAMVFAVTTEAILESIVNRLSASDYRIKILEAELKALKLELQLLRKHNDN
jgi:hypothetical protein